ncbi:UBA/TS-N domain-containing protein [Coprinopsis cinerea okayama7|uniref:UBA/TS-N domain-containing protein n=1 Tax=Coprinopsis cinerea (strain Okayama-7 / 130 / ATCC MYA-4618 / FGSC 9003) TaxID=240176 RepID=A8NG54_COPC7|nr:UBA/TS-N domain-containing protein [Coprinopsis cinerea okayama7\|eukprot:XP_001833479.1 UBA/TS-N domain-containing protein [Coprinopsis cinerea okayama7\
MPANITPTPAEASLVNQIFLHADPQKLGVITGDAAVKVFDGSKLPAAVLGEIWSLADEDNNGWLSKKGVAIVVRLMGWAQKGEPVSEALIQKPGPLPRIEGISTVTQQNTGMSLPKSPLPYFPPLSPQDKEKFDSYFIKYGATNGLLSGEKARDVFLKSKLPNEQLLQIWNLADTQDRGALDSTDFAIGMYFIQGLMSGKISFIPTSLPPGLYQQAGGGGVASHMTGGSGNFSPAPGSAFSIQPQYTGQRSQIQPNHTGMSNQARSPALPPRPAVPSIAARSLSPPIRPPVSVAPTPAWDITPADKARFDQWFDDLDKDKVGFIEGSVAVPFMIQSGLPGEVLAVVWDLSDLNNDGKLTRDGFAVAMHLIQRKLGGGEIPATLPPSLIPPSMRQAQPPAAPEPQKDLFSFDDSPPASPVPSQATGNKYQTLQPQRTGPLQTMTPQPTGGRSVSMPLDPFAASLQQPNYTGSARNLLDDDEPTTSTSPPLQDQSAEIGNVKNQLASTNNSLEKTRSDREAIEQSLATQASQLSALQVQLSSAKAAYETEIKLFTTLKDRHTSQQAEIEKIRQELISAESDLSAKRVEKAEIEGAFMRDKEDKRELERRMIEAGQQIEAIKAEVEKLKKAAKQQKGLLAIAKKQLATKEAERAKAQDELQEANAELEEVTKETEETEAALAKLEMPQPKPAAPPIPPRATSSETIASADTLAFAASQPLPVTPDPVVSPSASIKSNNPFERLAMGNSQSRTGSPFSPFPSAPVGNPAEDDDIFASFAQPEKALSDEGGAQSTEGLPYDAPEPARTQSPDNSNKLTVEASEQPPVSPNETELFHTPPTSARALSPSDTSLHSLDGASSKFPAIDAVTAQISNEVAAAPASSKPANGNDDFDDLFGSAIQEKEIDESDSSDESDDEIPLAELNKSGNKPPAASQDSEKSKEGAKPAENNAQSFDDIFASSPPTKPTETAPPAATSDFDDIFNPTPAAVATQPTGDVAKSNGDADLFPPVDSKPAVAGVDAFDEALGLSTSTASKPAPAPAFSFDAAFDDNFDFSAAKADSPPVTAAAQPAQPPAAATNGASFDDIFSTAGPVNGHSGEATTSTTPSQISAQPTEAPKPEPAATSFDEAFNPAPTASPKPAPTVSTSSPPPTAPSTSPFPTGSPTTSPKNSLSSGRPRPSSPLAVRSHTPPPRTSSPKPRLSSSSSKDGLEKPKEPAPRHSKLSLRLPFGKKKNKDKHEPMPTTSSSHLTPHKETPERSVTPAGDDDVEAVKQLTDMGFSRSQAIDALERYGYDVPRALNTLLGAP